MIQPDRADSSAHNSAHNSAAETATERAARQRAEQLARRDAAEDDLDATGVCTLRVLPTDPVTATCPVCQHTPTAHPGWSNTDPELTGCVICHVKLLAGASASLRPHRRLLARREPPDPDCCPDYPYCSH